MFAKFCVTQLELGNGSGAGGFGIGRGDSAQVALERALVKATKDMVPLDISPEGTLYHDLIGKHNSTLVLLRSGAISSNCCFSF